jgi:hypothetical protein
MRSVHKYKIKDHMLNYQDIYNDNFMILLFYW